MIAIQNLKYYYPDKAALDDISFTLEQGTITALVGPNGAGKTTLMRCMASLLRPTYGSIFVQGIDALKNPHHVHRNMGYLSDSFGLYEELTARESITYIACSRMPNYASAIQNTEWAITLAGIEEFSDKEISKLSRGMRQRVGIAQAIVHRPQILMLDEPASGLDPEARYALSVLLKKLNSEGMTILVSSHILAELEDYSDSMLVMQQGKIIAHQQLHHNASDITVYKLEFDQPIGLLTEELKKLTGVKMLEQESEQILLVYFAEKELSRKALLAWLNNREISPVAFGSYQTNMQDHYLKTIQNHRNG